MQLEIRDKEGAFGTIEVTPEKAQELRELLGLGTASAESEAQLKESQGKVEELGGQVAELGEKLATAEARTMGDFTPIEKANFVIDWAKELTMEDKAIFCEGVGIPLAKVTEAEVAEAAKQAAGEAVEDPAVIQGKTDRPGYKFLEYLNMSVKE